MRKSFRWRISEAEGKTAALLSSLLLHPSSRPASGYYLGFAYFSVAIVLGFLKCSIKLVCWFILLGCRGSGVFFAL